jgi:sugar lactone lactonase YvrE
LNGFAPPLLIVVSGVLVGGVGPGGSAVVSTLAGNGAVGFFDGPAVRAEFRDPAGIAVDRWGDVVIADNGNQRIRVIRRSSRRVATVAGSGHSGFADGRARVAEFSYPVGVAVDAAGDTYVADTGNEAIRLVAAGSHLVTTLAGDGRRGFVDGAAATAEFNTPLGVAVDASGNVYVADAGNDRIRVIAAGSRNVRTYAGRGVAGYADGPADHAEFDHPTGVAVDAAGNVYVADAHNNRVRVIAAGTRIVSTLAGTGVAGFADGPSRSAAFDDPLGIAVDASGDVYVADSLNARIRVIDSSTHVVSSLAGNGTAGFRDGAAALAGFRAPYAVAVGRDGKVYVADMLAERVRVISRGAVARR